MNLFDEIRQAEMQVHELRERLLDKLGWTFSSAYPDHFCIPALISEVEALRVTLKLIKEAARDMQLQRDTNCDRLEKAKEALQKLHDIPLTVALGHRWAESDALIVATLAELEDKKEPDLNQFGVNPTIE